MKSFSKIDLFFYFGLIVLLTFFTYIYLFQIPLWKIIINKQFSKEDISLLFNNKTDIGYVEQNIGTNQRRKNDEILFESIGLKDKVFYKDTIFSGKDGHLILKLYDGSLIEIAEQSMIKLDFSTSETFLDFTKKPIINVIEGNVTDINPIKSEIVNTENKPTIKIVSKKRVVQIPELKAIPIKLAKDKPSNYDEIKKEMPILSFKPIEPIREIASIIEKDPELMKINSVESKVINAMNNSNILDKDQFKQFQVLLKWDELIHEDKNQVVDYYKVVLNDLDSKKTISEMKTSNSKIIYNSLFIPYKTVYEIFAFNKKNQLIGHSDKKIFKFDYKSPIITHPINNEKLDKIKKPIVVISWRSLNFTTEYTIQISKTQQFDKIEDEYSTQNNYMKFKMKPGVYFTRVKASNRQFSSTWSLPVTFEVLQ